MADPLITSIGNPNKFPAHRGVPIGVVQLKPTHLQTFRNLLDKTLKIKTRFRGVDKERNGNGKVTMLTVHLPPIVCAVLDDRQEDMIAFLNSVGGTYLAGVRRSKATALQEAKKMSSSRKRKRPTMSEERQHETNCKKSQSSPSSFRFTFVELFAGIGGFRLGLENIGGKCVLSSEINPHSAAIYEAYFGGSSDHGLEIGDVLDLQSSSLGQFTMLTAGFPCQPFTNRGNQKGLNDNAADRGQMYRECARFLYDQRPECFLFENVVGLVMMEGGSRPSRKKSGCNNNGDDDDDDQGFIAGRVLEHVIDSFRSCGYHVDWKVINSRHFLPQNRERVYIVGTRDDLKCESINWSNVLPEAGASSIRMTVRDILEDRDSAWVKRSELSSDQWIKVQDLHNKKGGNVDKDGRIDIDGKAPTIITNYRRVGSFSTRFMFEESDGTIRDGKEGHLRPRFLTPRECASIMGFPDDFCCPSPTEEDDAVIAQFYQAIGNAVTPPVISAIGKELLRCVNNALVLLCPLRIPHYLAFIHLSIIVIILIFIPTVFILLRNTSTSSNNTIRTTGIMTAYSSTVWK